MSPTPLLHNARVAGINELTFGVLDGETLAVAIFYKEVSRAELNCSTPAAVSCTEHVRQGLVCC